MKGQIEVGNLEKDQCIIQCSIGLSVMDTNVIDIIDINVYP